MYDFSTILYRFKGLLAHETGKGKIKDKEVAAALGLTPEYFAVIKKRGKIPYEALLRYCLDRHVNINWLFSGSPPLYMPAFDPTTKKSYNKSAYNIITKEAG